MDSLYNQDFFLYNDYESEISKHIDKLDLKNSKVLKEWFKQVLELEDIYISLYLCIKIKPQVNFIDNNILILMGKLIDKYRNEIKYHLVDISKIIRELIVFIDDKVIEIGVFVNSMKTISFKDHEISNFQKIFGFSQVYKFFKESIMKNIFDNDSHDFREIGLVLRLLNNPELAKKSILPILQRTTKYVSDGFIDKNFAKCIEVLKSIIAFEPSIFSQNPEYMASISSFILEILNNPMNFRFLSLDDTNNLLEGIEIFANSIKTYKSMKKISFGSFQKAYEYLKILVSRKTTVYEEFINISCLLGIILIYYKLSFELGSKMFDYDQIFKFIQEISHNIPKAVDRNEWNIVYGKYLSRKYKLLDAIIPYVEEVDFDSDIFNRDLTSSTHAFDVIKNLDNLCKFVKWEHLIVLLCDPKMQENFIELVFKDIFFKNDEKHLEYVQIYIDSLIKNNKDDLLLLAIDLLLVKLTEEELTYNQRHIIITIFLKDIENDVNQIIISRRRKILDFLFYRTKKDYSRFFIEELLIIIFENHYLEHNLNILIFLLLLSRKDKNLPESTLNDICRYIVEVLTRGYEINNSGFSIKNRSISSDKNQIKTDINETEKDSFNLEFTHDDKIYIAAIVEILCLHKNEIHFNQDNYIPDTKTYIKIYIAVLCFISDSYSEEYLEHIKQYLLNFLFSANEVQKKTLGYLFKRVDDNIVLNYDIKCDILDIFEFVKIRIERLK